MSDLSGAASNYFSFPKVVNGEKPIELRALTHGLPPKSIQNNLDLFFREWSVSGVDSWNKMQESAEIFCRNDADSRDFGWWTLPEVIGDRFISPLLNAPNGSCIMLPNATQIVFGILSCKELNQPGRRKVICTDGEFSAVLHTLHHFNNQFENHSEAVRGAVQLDISIIEMGEKPFDAQKIIDEIDDQTALVIFSHIGFTRGERVLDSDIKRIVEKARKHRALVAIDAYHSIANQKIDVQDLGVDLYFAGLLKEGCGSSGNCFLYIKPGLDLHPSLSGWFADLHPFAFNIKPTPNDSVRRRFLTGTTAIAPLYHSVEGIKIMLQFGLDDVAKDVLDKVEVASIRLAEAGIEVVSPLKRESMSSLIVFKVKEANLFRDCLIEDHGVMVDSRRNEYIRLAPHIYNSNEEMESAIQKITTVFQSMQHLQRQSTKRVGPVT